jgi:hypothetical protein
VPKSLALSGDRSPHKHLYPEQIQLFPIPLVEYADIGAGTAIEGFDESAGIVRIE